MSAGEIEGKPLMAPPIVDGAYDSTGKSPQQIEADIAATRADLGEILDALERQLAPWCLLERGVGVLRDTMSGEGDRLGDTLRNHPVPLAMIGISVGWMLMSSSRRARIGEFGAAMSDRASGTVQNGTEQAGKFEGQVRDQLGSINPRSSDLTFSGPCSTTSRDFDYARQKSGEARETNAAVSGALKDTPRRVRKAGHATGHRASDVTGQASRQLSDARYRLTQLIDDRTLVMVGALGLLAGCTAAILLRRTQIDQRLVGPAAEEH